MVRAYSTWATDACDRCGNEFQVTRTEARVYEDGEDVVCNDCDIWEKAEGAFQAVACLLEIARLRKDLRECRADRAKQVDALFVLRAVVEEQAEALESEVPCLIDAPMRRFEHTAFVMHKIADALRAALGKDGGE